MPQEETKGLCVNYQGKLSYRESYILKSSACAFLPPGSLGPKHCSARIQTLASVGHIPFYRSHTFSQEAGKSCRLGGFLTLSLLRLVRFIV